MKFLSEHPLLIGRCIASFEANKAESAARAARRDLLSGLATKAIDTIAFLVGLAALPVAAALFGWLSFKACGEALDVIDRLFSGATKAPAVEEAARRQLRKVRGAQVHLGNDDREGALHRRAKGKVMLATFRAGADVKATAKAAVLQFVADGVQDTEGQGDALKHDLDLILSDLADVAEDGALGRHANGRRVLGVDLKNVVGRKMNGQLQHVGRHVGLAVLNLVGNPRPAVVVIAEGHAETADLGVSDRGGNQVGLRVGRALGDSLNHNVTPSASRGEEVVYGALGHRGTVDAPGSVVTRSTPEAHTRALLNANAERQ